MKQFDYKIKDEIGIHARPAGLLAKEAKTFSSIITIKKNEKSAVATKLMSVMGMGIKCGDVITVIVEGEDEDVAAASMKTFLEMNL